jgi:hypothetical protein
VFAFPHVHGLDRDPPTLAVVPKHRHGVVELACEAPLLLIRGDVPVLEHPVVVAERLVVDFLGVL